MADIQVRPRPPVATSRSMRQTNPSGGTVTKAKILKLIGQTKKIHAILWTKIVVLACPSYLITLSEMNKKQSITTPEKINKAICGFCGWRSYVPSSGCLRAKWVIRIQITATSTLRALSCFDKVLLKQHWDNWETSGTGKQELSNSQDGACPSSAAWCPFWKGHGNQSNQVQFNN